MSGQSETKGEPLHIHARADGDRQIVMHPEDDDLFIQTGRQVIEACQLDISIRVWLDEFRSLLEAVEQWAREHADRVEACYAAPRGASIGLYFLPRQHSYDFDLADLLAPMNRSWMQQFNVGMIEVHQIPAAQLDRFAAPSSRRSVYAHD